MSKSANPNNLSAIEVFVMYWLVSSLVIYFSCDYFGYPTGAIIAPPIVVFVAAGLGKLMSPSEE